jgi:RHS repeat-associated protein
VYPLVPEFKGTGSTDVTYTYDPVGQRTGMGDSTGASTYTFDNAGRETAETNAAGGHVGYSFDAAGRMTALTYPNGSTVTYGYDSAGQMTSVTDAAQNTTGFAWSANGQLSTQTSANGVVQSRSYDPNGQTTAITTSNAGTTLDAFTYGYDAAGHLTADSTTASSHTYQYDPLNQLSTVATTPVGSTSSTSSSYTATPGGLLTKTTAVSTLAYNSAQELTSLTPATGGATTYAYDGRGARVSSATAASGTVGAVATKYSYTPSGALSSVTLPAGNVVGYTSNGNDLRQSRTTAGVTTAFTWATAGKLPLLLDDGGHTYIYGPSSSPVAQIDDSTHVVEYLHDDLIGTPKIITNTAGVVSGANTYDPYGNQTAHSGASASSIGYSGNWTDTATGLVYLRARDYDPVTAQFLTVDPAIDKTRQPYTYVANDPLQLTDPSGLDAQWDAALNIGFHLLAPGIAMTVDSYNARRASGNDVWNSLVMTLDPVYSVLEGYSREIDDTQKGCSFGTIARDGLEAVLGVAGTVGIAAGGAELAGSAVGVEGAVGASQTAVSSSQDAIHSPGFIVKPNGETVIVPKGATGPTPTKGAGFQFTGGSGGHGLHPTTSDVRIMDPYLSGPYPKPNGYASYLKGGQTVQPFSGQTVGKSDPWWHWEFTK